MPHPFDGIPFTELQSVDSTNNYALARVHAGLAQDGEAFFAHEQVSGKGQMGRKWSSQKGENILLSIVHNPDPLLLSQQFQLSAAVAVGLHDFYKNYGGDETRIKWPNDLYWQDRKAAGILIESVAGNKLSDSENLPADNQGSGTWKWSVIGIGVNLNQTSFPADLINPVSLKQITGKSFETVSMARELYSCISSRLLQLKKEGFANIYNDYNSHLYKRNETVKLKKDTRVFEAIIKSVSQSGRLIVEHGIEEEFDFGQIEWPK